MKHILNNATEGLAEPWVTYKEGVVYYKNIEPIIPTKVWYVDGSYKEFDIEGTFHGEIQSHYGTLQIDNYYDAIKIELGNKVTEIKDLPFYHPAYTSSLMTIVIPNSVTSIGSSAFSSCSSLTSVTIPDSVTSIGERAFRDCSGLTSVTMPNNVTSIGEDAFYGCSSLTSITIPNSITSISNHTFNSCSNLISVTIQDSVTSIGISAFNGCRNLTSVTYNGTTTQWNAITKGIYWKLNVPSTCIVHCTDGDISIADA